MPVKGKKAIAGDKKATSSAIQHREPTSLKIAARGVKTGTDFAELMSSLMTDIIQGSITPAVGNATCNAGGKLLKVVEMQYRYGSTASGKASKVLELTR